MKLHKDSHLDHALTQTQIDHVLARFAGRESFFLETFELPEELGAVPCGLYGPRMGDEPITDAMVVLGMRGERRYSSRLIARPKRPTRSLTVIAGPHDGEPCVLFTAFGGPVAPPEPASLIAPGADLVDFVDSSEEMRKAVAFWAEHALAISAGDRLPGMTASGIVKFLAGGVS